MYRNAVYNSKTGTVKLFTWDQEGRRISVDSTFSPYLYVDSPRGDKTSIFGTSVMKRVFRNSWERTSWVRDSGTSRVYENIRPEQQFLIDMFWREHEKDEFTANPLKVLFVDIETFSAKRVNGVLQGDGFPNVEDPQHMVNVITCYDSLSKQFTTFGVGDYDNKFDDVTYIKCSTEKQMFIRYIEYLEQDYPDVISGWNSSGFDIPYIVARCQKIFDDDIVNRMSPCGRVYSRVKQGMFGKEQIHYYFDGISSIDYLDIYKKFRLQPRESYKLDAIGEIELGEKKIDYGDQQLWELADEDWQTFVDYNIQDVRLLVNLEEKLKYVSLLRMLSYVSCTTFENAMSPLNVTSGALTMQARAEKLVMSTFIRPNNNIKNPGAFVAEPIKGFQNNVVSFDANSLYPNIIISLNISLETKLGKVTRSMDGGVNIDHVSGKTFTLTKDQFKDFLVKEQCALASSGMLFSQKKKGIMPMMLDYYYKKRKKTQAELYKVREEIYKLKKEGVTGSRIHTLEVEKQRLDTKQLAEKILLNASYGFLGNKHASAGDDDLASATTLTGQAVIKQSADILKRHLTEEYGVVDSEVLDKSWVYSDTDSCYFTLDSIKDQVPLLDDNGDISQDFYKACDKLENYLNNNIKMWAKRSLLTTDSRFVFKREIIADSAMFIKKKRYVMHILDDEGIKTSKFKYKGIDVVRSTMPSTLKPYAKDIINTMLTTQSLSETNKKLNIAYDRFVEMPAAEMSFVMGIGNYEAGESKCDGLNIGKGVTVHVKAAYYHNTINDMIGIGGRTELIKTGDKVRFYYVNKPNKYNVPVIGFKYKCPEEYVTLFPINYDLMFEKIMFNSVQRLYNSVNWNIRKPSENINTELSELFG